MGLIASAAAVVAAGTLSGQVQSVADNNGRQNAPAANIGGAFGSGRTSSSAPAGSTSGTLPSTVPVRSGTVLSFPESASLTTGKPVTLQSHTLQSRSFRVSSHLGGMTPAP
jgi:hypothetical protein